MTRFADDSTHGLDLVDVRARLHGTRGPQYWRSLEELAGSEDFQEYLHREFPQQASEWADPASRRQFLRLMGASLALSGISGCAYQPPEEIVPYVRSPEEVVPGKPLFFASAFPLDGYGLGVLVENHMGRPTKIEGNANHPASLGATDAFAQASILTLYDPDRSQTYTRGGRVSTFDDLLAELIAIRGKAIENRGRGLRILTEPTTSPTFLRLMGSILAEFPEAAWTIHDPACRHADRDGAQLAFGAVLEPVYHLDKANVIVSLGADFLSNGPARVRMARDFASRREPDSPAGMNRLFVAESMPSITGSVAEHRLPATERRLGGLLQELARRLGVADVPAPASPLDEEASAWVHAAVADLEAHRGKGVVIAGENQPPAVHALAYAVNSRLENLGQTVELLPPPGLEVVQKATSLEQLVGEMNEGQVETLLILGGNPAFTAPADLDFPGALEEVPTAIRLGLYDDETSLLCNWQVPEAHYLEAWGDIRAFDGTATIQQPLIAPLYDGQTAAGILSALAGQPNLPGQQLVRTTWLAERGEDGFDTFWRSTLRDGVVPGTATESTTPTLASSIDWSSLIAETGTGPELELSFRPDPTIWDGTYSNNGWLQELPKPLTKLTWDNAALMSTATARRLGISSNEQIVELRYRGRSLEMPVWLVPGHADDSITVHLGYGRRRVGRVGDGAGFDVYSLRDSASPWFDSGLEIVPTDRRYELATTQHHFNMEGRELVRSATLEHFREHPDFAQVHHGPPPAEAAEGGHAEGEHAEAGHPEELSLFQNPPVMARRIAGEGNAWGMVINLNTCIGCNACVVACQAENNIPVVGKEQVRRGREMHWIRIDRYYEGGTANPKTYHQPVPCMHCEQAPCELVCPVAATSHSPEGLNEMTYNRCVGTRYCGNNCPYKVRRFNFFQYSDLKTQSLKMQRNPEVTIRTRGIMEKCTYCVQRINRARIAAEVDYQRGNRETPVVQYGELETACQGVCPTRAITFGNQNDRQGLVAQQKSNPRNYALLAELNVRPRTTYLAKLTNPSSALDSGESHDHE